MFTNVKLRFLFIVFFVVGLVPIYIILATNLEADHLVEILQAWLIRHSAGCFIAVASTFLYLRVTSNDTDPTWVTMIGTISIFLFCSYISGLLILFGIPFVLSSMLLGLGFGTKFYELDFKESIPIGFILWGASIASAFSGLLFI